ncbi:nitroreductase family deazaflavin-dependent oxidoreductase [Myceligenerans cantabricum]
MDDNGFTYPHGTHGARQPRGALLAWANRLVARWAGKRSRPVGGMKMLALHTVGARSGQARQTPVTRFDGGDGTWLVVASAAGASGNPAWYHNLAAHPDQVAVDVGGKHLAVTPAELSGQERAAAWEQIVTEVPRFAHYGTATDRLIPVIRLTPRP